MDWEQRALSQTLFGPASFTKKSPKPLLYDPVTHLSKKFSYDHGQYRLIDREVNLSPIPEVQKGRRTRMAQSGEYIVSQYRDVKEQYRFTRNRVRKPEISPITGLPVEVPKGRFSPDPVTPSVTKSFDFSSSSPLKIAGSLRKPVPSVAYVNPLALRE